MSIFLDDMAFCRSDDRQRLPVALDAGYVSIASTPVEQLTKTFGLHGRRLICVVCAIVTLFLISFINFTVIIIFDALLITTCL